DLFLEAAGYDIARDGHAALPCSWSTLWEHCHEITGFGICEALAAAMHRLGLDADRRTVVIQGFGTVGRAGASDLSKRGLRVVAVADRNGTLGSADGLAVGDLIGATDASGTIARDR